MLSCRPVGMRLVMKKRAILRAAIACATTVLVVAGCSTMTQGRALSMLNDPFRVGDLPATNGPSGIRANAPAPDGTVVNTDNGPIDKLSLLSVNDIEDYWKSVYSQSLKGTFLPVGKLVSYDSNSPSSPIVCHNETYKLVNAFFTSRCNLIAWDRTVFMAVAQRYFGDMSVTGVLAHEFGHALQQMAKLVTRSDPTIVREQQADCFAGVYLYWVASGKSSRFTLSTADGLDHVLAGIITTRDPVQDSDTVNDDEHGTSLDRISAFQMGFISGASACAGINKQEITQRRGDLPTALQVDPNGDTETGEVPDQRGHPVDADGVVGKGVLAEEPTDVVLQDGRLPGCQGQPAGVLLSGDQHHRRGPARAGAAGQGLPARAKTPCRRVTTPPSRW